MNEERELLLKAVEATRKSDKRLLGFGAGVLLASMVLVVLVSSWAADPDSAGGYLGRLSAQLVVGVVAMIGASLVAASYGRFDETGNRKTWYVIVTAIPLVGGVVRLVVKRHGKEQVNAPAQLSNDDPFLRS